MGSDGSTLDLHSFTLRSNAASAGSAGCSFSCLISKICSMNYAEGEQELLSEYLSICSRQLLWVNISHSLVVLYTFFYMLSPKCYSDSLV